MTLFEIVIIVLLVSTVFIGFCVYLINSKKIKNKQKKDKKVTSNEVKNESKEEKIKKIITNNSIDVENYLKSSLVDDEIKTNKQNEIKFEEVENISEGETKPKNLNDAIILGHKRQSVFVIEDDNDDDFLIHENADFINQELDRNYNKRDKHNFTVENLEEDTDKNNLSEEISGLSKEAKVVLISNALKKKKNDLK